MCLRAQLTNIGVINAQKIKIITISGKIFCSSAGPPGAYYPVIICSWTR